MEHFDSVKVEDKHHAGLQFLSWVYTNSKLSEIDIKKTVIFTVASKTMKCLGINLTQQVKGVYPEIYKALIQEAEEATNEKYSVLMNLNN